MAIDPKDMDKEEDAPPATPNSFAPRDNAVEAIAEARKNALLAEMEEPEPEPEPEPKVAKEKAPELFTVKINGVEKQVTRDALITAYQQDTAAAQRLEAAARRQKEVEADAAKLAKDREEFEASRKVGAGETEDDVVARLRDAILDGDVDTLDASIRDALFKPKSPVTPAPDADRLAKQATAAALYQIDVRNAVAAFEKEHPDLAADEWTRGLIDRETEVIQRQNPNMSVAEIMRNAIETVTSRMDRHVGKKPTGDHLNMNEREAAKAKASKAAVPTAPGAKASIGEEPPEPQFRSDIITEMKKARGQA